MKGTYKVNTRGETVTFHFTIPLGQGAYNQSVQSKDEFNFSISQLRFDENGMIKYSKTKSTSKTPLITSFQIPNSSLNTELKSHQKSKGPKCLKTGIGKLQNEGFGLKAELAIDSFCKINEDNSCESDGSSNFDRTPIHMKRESRKFSAKFGSSPQEMQKSNSLKPSDPQTPKINNERLYKRNLFKKSRNACSTSNEETKFFKYLKFGDVVNEEIQNLGLKQLKASEVPSVPICNEYNAINETVPKHYSFGSQKKMKSKVHKLKNGTKKLKRNTNTLAMIKIPSGKNNIGIPTDK